MCKADMMDAEEATTISMQRITCVTTVYLDDMAKKFYLKNDMKEMLPPYDDGMRRNSSKGAAPRKRIWDNCDHKRLHWWFNTIHGSSFSGDETPEESLKLALENTVDRCKRGEAKDQDAVKVTDSRIPGRIEEKAVGFQKEKSAESAHLGG